MTQDEHSQRAHPPGGTRTQPIEAKARAVIGRERLADAAWGLGAVALPAGLVTAAVAVVVSRLFCLPSALSWAAVLPVVGVLVWAFARPRSVRAAIRRLDAHYGLHDQLGHAMEMDAADASLGSRDPRARALADLTIDAALSRVTDLDPRPVVTMPRPAPRLVDGLALGLLGATFLLPEICEGDLPPAAAAGNVGGETRPGTEAAEGMDLSLAEPLREDLRSLEDGEDTPAHVAAAIGEILDGLERGDLDRAEAMAELEALEKELAEAELAMEAAEEEDPWMLGEAMRDLAESFEKHEITEEVAKALERGDPEAVEQALREALEKAEAAGGDTKDAMDEALEDAERSLSRNANQQTDTASELAEAERRLKREQKREPEADEDPQARERRLKRQQERVDQLRRQHEAEQRARDALDELRRQAQQSRGQGGGQKQQQGRKQAQQKMSQGAGGASRKAGGARRMSSARDALEEAKSFVRRAGNRGESGERRKKQQKAFSNAAKGKRGDGKNGKDGKGGKNGKDGDGPTLLVEGEVGEGEPKGMLIDEGNQGQGGQDGQGQGENGQAGQEGQGQGGNDGPGQQGQGQNRGVASGVSIGDGMGDGSMDPQTDEERGMDVDTKNVRVDADKGRGATRAEVIRDSSQQGFASQSYRRVYSDYRAFAQSAMDNETMPPGQRRRVKRYFQLIQPRQGGGDETTP